MEMRVPTALSWPRREKPQLALKCLVEITPRPLNSDPEKREITYDSPLAIINGLKSLTSRAERVYPALVSSRLGQYVAVGCSPNFF